MKEEHCTQTKLQETIVPFKPLIHQTASVSLHPFSSFASDLAASRLCSDLGALGNTSADELVELYSVIMTSLLDKHCPVVKGFMMALLTVVIDDWILLPCYYVFCMFINCYYASDDT